MINEFLVQIEKHFSDNFPYEACGVIAIKKGKLNWIPCTNIAEEADNFIMDSTEYLNIYKTSDIVGIVHNHPNGTAEASEVDIENCNTLGIPYYIFSYPEMELNVVTPKQDFTKLYGREYKFGIYDCFEAMRDYLSTQNINIPARIPFEDDWFDKDLDYFCPKIIKKWGGVEIDINNIEKNDVITFKVKAEVANHCGVFLGNDIFYHHAVDRLSCRENLYPFWVQHIDRVYRYEA
jgi:proteasome lid subunit RPN8/RPN11